MTPKEMQDTIDRLNMELLEARRELASLKGTPAKEGGVMMQEVQRENRRLKADLEVLQQRVLELESKLETKISAAEVSTGNLGSDFSGGSAGDAAKGQ